MPYWATPSSSRPRIGGRKADSRGAHLRLRRTVERGPSDENGAASPMAPFGSKAAAPTASVTGTPAPDRRADRGGRTGRQTQNRDLDRAVRPEGACRQRPVDENRRRPRGNDLPDGLRGRRPPWQQRRCTGDPAVARFVEEARQATRRTDDDRGGSRERDDGGRDREIGGNDTAEGLRARDDGPEPRQAERRAPGDFAAACRWLRRSGRQVRPQARRRFRTTGRRDHRCHSARRRGCRGPRRPPLPRRAARRRMPRTARRLPRVPRARRRAHRRPRSGRPRTRYRRGADPSFRRPIPRPPCRVASLRCGSEATMRWVPRRRGRRDLLSPRRDRPFRCRGAPGDPVSSGSAVRSHRLRDRAHRCPAARHCGCMDAPGRRPCREARSSLPRPRILGSRRLLGVHLPPRVRRRSAGGPPLPAMPS